MTQILILKKYFHPIMVALLFILVCNFSLAQEKRVESDFKQFSNERYDELYASKVYGSLMIQPSPEIDKDSEVVVYDKAYRANKLHFYIGDFKNRDIYELILPPGNYHVNISTAGSFFKRAISRQLDVKIESGIRAVVIAEKDGLVLSRGVNISNTQTKRGSIFSFDNIISMMQPRVVFQLGSYENNKLKIFARVFNGNGTPKFFLNNKNTSFGGLTSLVQNGVEYSFDLNLDEGKNNFVVEVNGINGALVSNNIEYYAKTAGELEQERVAKQRQELDRLARLETERRARVLEEERIAREGDGSPDDIQCKRYGLKPQTQGYAECRMRLDLSRKEASQRIDIQNRQIAAQQELLRQQRQSAENARENRESQCRFVKSAEYLKPTTTGNFFESAMRANSAFENCMNGVPTINTTCTRDGFGNMNCTSR